MFLGYFLGENEALIKDYLHEIILLALGAVFMIAVVYIWLYKRGKKAKEG